MKIMSHAIKRLEAHDVVYKNGGVAQLGEHLPCKQGVKSSNLSVSITVSNYADGSCTLKTSYRNDFDEYIYQDIRETNQVYS